MKEKLLGRGIDLLILFINHWIVSNVVVIVLGASKFEKPYFLLWISLWIIPVYFYYIRAYINKFYLFFVLQFLPTIVVCIIPFSIGLKIAAVCMTVFYTFYSIKQKLSEDSEEEVFNAVASVSVLGMAYIIDDIGTHRGWHEYYILTFYVYMIGFVCYYFLSQYKYFIVVNRNSAGNIPEKQIFQAGSKQMLTFILGGTAILLISSNIEWLGYIWAVFKEILGIIIRFLTSLIKTNESKTPPVEDAVGNGGGGMGFLEPAEAGLFWIILEKIATVAIIAGVVYLVVVGIVKGYYYLRNNFQKGKSKKAEVIHDGQDIREKCETEERIRKEFKFFAFLDNREKIRKIYRKRMIKQKSSIIGDSAVEMLEYQTAKECCEKVMALDLQMAYEKARYSDKNVSAEDVKLAKTDY